LATGELELTRGQQARDLEALPGERVSSLPQAAEVELA